MSDYGSQLKGWAIDRVLQMAKANQEISKQTFSLEDVMAEAKKLSEFCYTPQEAANDIQQTINDLQMQLEQLAALAVKPASNALEV